MYWNTIREYARRTAGELSNVLHKHPHDGTSERRAHHGKPSPDLRTELNTWEDEGGSTTAPRKTVAMSKKPS